jgi:hypothetical protein
MHFISALKAHPIPCTVESPCPRGIAAAAAAAEHEAKNSLPSYTEVQDLWGFTSTSPLCLLDVVLRHMGKFTFSSWCRMKKTHY